MAVLTLVFSVTTIGVLMNYTTPDQIGPLGVTLLFVLSFVVSLSTLTLIKMLFNRSTRVTINGLVSWAFVPVLFLGLGTLKQLTVVDVGLVLLFSAFLGFYIKRATKKL